MYLFYVRENKMLELEEVLKLIVELTHRKSKVEPREGK